MSARGWRDAVADVTVCDYESGDDLDGSPSEALVEASLDDQDVASGGSGAGGAYAYRDAAGVWQLLDLRELEAAMRIPGYLPMGSGPVCHVYVVDERERVES